MFDTDKPEERGQVGIGTLIVFIALVLVAAIAAGVLINTAGFLQSQAEATGEESTSQVSDGINVYNSYSTSTNSGTSGITQAEIRVGLAPGAEPINVTNVDISAVGPGGTASGAITAVSGNSIVSPSAATLSNSEDRVTITLDLDGSSPGDATAVDLSSALPSNGLEPGDELELTLTTSSGSQTFEVLRAPDPITGATEL